MEGAVWLKWHSVVDAIRIMCALPGTTKLHRLEENLGSTSVELRAEDLREIQSALSEIEMQGARYPEHLQKLVGR